MEEQRQRLIDQFKQNAKQRGLPREQATSELADELKRWDKQFGTVGGENILQSLGRILAYPFAETGKTLYTTAAVADPRTRKLLAEEGREAFGPLAGLIKTEPELKQISERPSEAITKQAKASAGMAAYAVPFGRGTSLLTRATLPGTVAGTLATAPQVPETASPLETLGQLGLGGVLGGITATVLTKLSDYARSKIQTAIQKKAILDRLEQTGSWKPSDFGKGDWTQENFLKREGAKLVATQEKMPMGMARSTEGMETARKMADYGMANIDDWQKTPKIIEKINKITSRAVGKADRVKSEGLLETADELLVNSPQINESKQKGMRAFFKNILIKMTGGAKGSLRPDSNPLDTFETIRVLERQAADIYSGVPTWNITNEDRAMIKVYYLMADELKDRLFIEAGANKQLIGSVSGKEANELRAVSQNLYNDVVSAKTVSQLRNILKPLVDANKIAIETERVATSPFYGLGGGQPRGLGKLAGGLIRGLPGAEALLESRPVTSGSAQVLRNMGQRMSQVPETVRGGISQAAIRALGILPKMTPFVPQIFSASGRGR